MSYICIEYLTIDIREKHFKDIREKHCKDTREIVLSSIELTLSYYSKRKKSNQ